MILYLLIFFDICTFLIWTGSFVWFLSVDPTLVVFDEYRTQHTTLLVHAIATWQLMWLVVGGKRVRWQTRVRRCIFFFTLVLDTFMLVRTIRFTSRTNEVAWGIQVAISTLFMTSSLCALLFEMIVNKTTDARVNESTLRW